MKLLSVAGLCAVAPVWGAEQLRGVQWHDSDADSDAAPKGDYMDQYIANSGADKGNVWLKSEDAHPKRSDAASSGGDALSWVHDTLERQRQEWHMPRPSGLFGGGGPAAPPPAQPAASAGQQASSGGGGGAVVDIRLDSELQTKKKSAAAAAMLQGKAGARLRSAPNVEDAVAQQRLQDVYIHDTFSTDAAADTKAVKEIEASGFFKA